ncbi:MAG: DUF3822 family protein [Bacteroidales bacterium]|nr:DUF3822 family protein [Bacteroidales bacterium]MCF8332637.1 DUF3822 family protein [Bacteroidales bacterium]
MNETFTPAFKYRDEALDYSKTDRYVLSIQLAPDGFSFSVLDAELKKFLALETFPLQEVETSIQFCKKLDQWLEEYSWLKNRFHKSYILYESPKATLVPEPLFDGSEKGLYLNFNHKVTNYEQIRSDFLKNVEAYQIYSIPDCLKYRVDRNFKKAALYHFSTPLIESLIISNKNKDVTNKVFLNVRNWHLDIIILNDQGLRFYNSFYYSTPEDFIYFLLFVLEQLGFNPEDVDLRLMGNIKKFSKEYEMLFTYVRNIAFEPRTNSFGYSYVFDKVPAHFYYTLFNVNICGL